MGATPSRHVDGSVSPTEMEMEPSLTKTALNAELRLFHQGKTRRPAARHALGRQRSMFMPPGFAHTFKEETDPVTGVKFQKGYDDLHT